MHALVFTSMPVYAAPRPVQAKAAKLSEKKPPAAPAPLPAAPKVNVNRRVPSVAPPSATISFSALPSEAEIVRARVFTEPFQPVGGIPSAEENRAFATAIQSFVNGSDVEDVTPFGVFLNTYPETAWRASLVTNLGAHYKATGYYTRAGETLMDGWRLVKDKPGRAAAEIGERALYELLDMYCHFGNLEKLEEVVAEAEGRDLHGSVVQRLEQAKWAIYVLRERHHEAIASASVAVDELERHGQKAKKQRREVAAFHGKAEGATLAEVGDLAQRVGIRLRLARRSAGDFVPGSIIHLRSGHFSALVRQEGDRFMLSDPILGGDVWLSRAALLDEASGFALLPEASPSRGWDTVTPEAVRAVRGKCAAPALTPSTGQNNNSPQGPTCQTPMATYRFHTLLANLSITDTPVRYTPAYGPAIGFQLTYNHREEGQPSTFTYANFGNQWNFDWLAFIEEYTSLPTRVYLRGGGREIGTKRPDGSYEHDVKSRALLVRTASGFERQLPDGSVEFYEVADTGVNPRRFFLSKWTDPAGNAAQMTYDGQFRVVAVTDALEQVTTVSYGLSIDPFKVTSVADPFGRSATFEYQPSQAGEWRLFKITDVIGITSEFAYGDGDFIKALTTPYGTTRFAQGVTHAGHGDKFLEAIDPLGGKERIEYKWSTPAIPAQEAVVPQGFINNAALDTANSFYWDKLATARHPGDYTKAVITHWLREFTSGGTIGDNPHSEKKPLEGRVWYGQMGERYDGGVGSDGRPAKIGRVLDDGSSQIYRYEYNSKGLKTRVTDPLGRETVHEYAANEIDLLRVKQKNAGTYDLRQSFTNYSQHLPLTVADAAGQATAFTYNAQGQILTVTTPPRAGITENRTTTYIYETNGHLQSVTAPAAGATTNYTYDGYGRIRTVTDQDSYTLTYDYDALDRFTRITYPDGTSEETVYNRLDAEKGRDRLGRWTHTFHDALRRIASTRDPAGRTTTQQWCTCGSLDKIIDSDNHPTTWDRDLQGRVTREVRADGAAWEYTYETTTSRLKKLKDAKGQETQHTYFLDDRLQQASYPNAQVATPSVSYTYDLPYGRTATMVDGTGTTTFTYHPVTVTPTLGATQPATVDGPVTNDTVSYGYDELGRRVTRTLNGVTTDWAYDVLGRLTTLNDPLGSFTYTYAGTTGRPSSRTYPNGQTTTYAYLPNSGDKKLQEIHHRTSASGATLAKLTYGYDVVGNISLWAQQYGASAANAYDFKYDPANQLESSIYRTTAPTPVMLKRYGYAYDPVGNRTTEQIDDAPMQSSYDNRNRPVSQQPGGALLLKGGVSEPSTVIVGGRPAAVGSDDKFQGTAPVASGTSTTVVTATDPTGNVRTNTYQVTILGATQTFAHDANGNLTVEGTKTYEWDGANRLVRVLDGVAEVARFVYDGVGRRGQKISGGVTRTYVYDAEDILEERVSSGATLRYVHGPGIDEQLARVEAGAASYYLADHLGSILLTTDASATVTLTRQYDPWGNPLQGSATGGYTFTGREWDPETGLYYYRARYYDPKIGRFISEDPIGFDGGINFFAYVGNNPVNRVDPLGLACGASPSPSPSPSPQPATCSENCNEELKRFLVACGVGVVTGTAACASWCVVAAMLGPKGYGACMAVCMTRVGLVTSACVAAAFVNYGICMAGCP